MKNKKKKGQYGYRNYHKKIECAKVLFGFVMILVQLGARNLTDTDNIKNILTVMAVLSVLPTANVASPLLAGWRYKTIAEDFYRRVFAYEDRFLLLYDLIITSKEAIMPMDAIVIHPTGVYAYCPKEGLNIPKAEQFLNEMFIGHKLNPHVKIVQTEAAFFRRLDSLKPQSEYEDDGSLAYTANLLTNLSM